MYLRIPLSTAFGSWSQIFQQIFVLSRARQSSKTILKVLCKVTDIIQPLGMNNPNFLLVLVTGAISHVSPKVYQPFLCFIGS